ncbi:hypothetical protein PR202_gb29280 [Eleusine coracana subsp. coracana]|uniref:F-box domain-containing protein n=1 Tax=Eleusine coracana subsp. coracana TaxID=191504 RepID=A0AAV5G0Y1_ELECO|nr:hypothetical protein PR202_gb29280 [Eleusine coracana subsp. coracana]
MPPEIISSILHRLHHVEVMLCADKVCRSWRRATRHEPELWHRIHMHDHADLRGRGLVDLHKMAADAVLRSEGQCEEFRGEGSCVHDNVLHFISDQAPLLKRLILNSCREISHEGFVEAIKRFPLLEELELTACLMVCSNEALETVAVACRRLKHLRLGHLSSSCLYYEGEPDDRDATAIATLHGLRSLQLVHNELSNHGLEAILDSCPRLESLEICRCRNIFMNNALQAKCARISMLRLVRSSLSPRFRLNLAAPPPSTRHRCTLSNGWLI